MRLIDYLVQTQKKVSVGTSGGSSYLYIGVVNTQQIEDVFERWRSVREKLLPKNKERLKVMKSEFNLIKFHDEDERKQAQEAINKLSNTIKQDEKYLKEYTNPLDREIVDASNSLIEDDNVRIIIEGQESGSYWLESEVNNEVATKSSRQCS